MDIETKTWLDIVSTRESHRGDAQSQERNRIPVVNFTNILCAVFVPISFGQKITNLNCKQIKPSQNTFCIKKMIIKC